MDLLPPYGPECAVLREAWLLVLIYEVGFHDWLMKTDSPPKHNFTKIESFLGVSHSFFNWIQSSTLIIQLDLDCNNCITFIIELIFSCLLCTFPKR